MIANLLNIKTTFMLKEQEKLIKEPYLKYIAPSMQLKELQEELMAAKTRRKLAFVLGNGINRYAFEKAITWDELLQDLWEGEPALQDFPQNYKGLSLTEIFDIMCLKKRNGNWDENIKQSRIDICKKFKEAPFNNQLNKQLATLCVPILTTNYDGCLDANLKKHVAKISSTYPFDLYFSDKEITQDNYGQEFSVWHIHGRYNLQNSIRLGTADYMGLLTYTRNYLQKGANLFNVKKVDDPWGVKKYGEEPKEEKYHFSWLEIFYNCSLCINGLGLAQDETYLRWLLISRKKYLDRIGSNETGWYICASKDLDEGKKFFLKNVGINIIVIDDLALRYKDLFSF